MPRAIMKVADALVVEVLDDRFAALSGKVIDQRRLDTSGGTESDESART
jgi:hypothetical protein